MSIKQANWIKSPHNWGHIVPIFQKTFAAAKAVKSAELNISAMGVYEAHINGARVGEFVMAPGWTEYKTRVQYQTYDVTAMLQKDNTLQVHVGTGWARGRLTWDSIRDVFSTETALIAELAITYADGSSETIMSDTSWQCARSGIWSSELYDGEEQNSTITTYSWRDCVVAGLSNDILIPQEGEIVREMDYLFAKDIIITPKGETVIDFGQNITGYAIITAKGEANDEIRISHAEILDADGNFYTENYRSAEAKCRYILNGSGVQEFKPRLCFQGFRYIRLDAYPGAVKKENFKAAAVYSDMKRTGTIETSDPLINQLFQNIIWSQKDNFLDIPTDCPQRDERLGWTGDAQVFVRAASYNFDIQKFFKKWLRDLSIAQHIDGSVPAVIPNPSFNFGDDGNGSSAWGDAAVICPWQIYLTYNDKEILSDQFESMKRWVEFMRNNGDCEELWNATNMQFGDWLGMDAPYGSYKGSTDELLIASAYYAYSTSLFIKAGKVLGKDMSEYEALYAKIVKAYQNKYIKNGKLVCDTQTAHVITLYFGLADDNKALCDRLVELIKESDTHLTTGFVGTPYLLHALSQNGHTELAYSLLLQRSFPSWLFSVLQGATTMWEHWDGIREDGSVWSKDMNSYNHYAYGAVADWMYGVMLGIDTVEEAPGFQKVVIAPTPDARLSYAKGSIDTKFGEIKSAWNIHSGSVHYKFDIPCGVKAEITVGGKTETVDGGHYEYVVAL